MPARIGVSYEGGHPPQTLREIVQTADELGAGTLWAASHLFLREPIANAGMVLAHTKMLGAALMAMSPYTVHPVYATMAAAALDEWFPGRVQLCFGSGAPRDLESVGLVAKGPSEQCPKASRLRAICSVGKRSCLKASTFRSKVGSSPPARATSL